ncbi:MAG: sthA [Phycisphaerales bacterium]|nr:sthA [Phycisphaerales bacterium]
MSRLSYDLVVIGSGPAGQKAASMAAKLGRRVALVDRAGSVGGVCIHTGTVPSKAMREAVLHLTGFRERSVYGDSYAVKQAITMDDLLYRCRHVVRTEVEVIRAQMARDGVTVLYGEASFADPHTVRVTRDDDVTEVGADHVLVATGTVPLRPDNVPFTPNVVFDSDGLLTLPRLPKSLIVVGGGVIGAEYACMLAAVGVRVTLVEGRPRLLEFVDDELSESLQFRMRDMGVRLRLGESVSKIEVVGGGEGDDGGGDKGEPRRVEATLASNKVLDADCLLYCVGRQGATRSLNLAAAGLAADGRGRLKVNEHHQTDVAHVYAAGDVIGFPALAATSMEQGRLAALHMFGRVSEGPGPVFPYGIYTIPEISMVGQTEQALTAAGTPYEVGIARYRETARGLLIADPHGLLKLLFHPRSRRLLGVHAIGTGATELIHIGQTVMAAGLPIDYFVESVFNYPTLAECYKIAAIDGINRVREPAADAAAVPAATGGPALAKAA